MTQCTSSKVDQWFKQLKVFIYFEMISDADIIINKKIVK